MEHSPKTQMALFQPNNKPFSLSKLFHRFWPHTPLHSHQFSGMRFVIKTHTLPAVSQAKTRSQTQIHRDKKSQTQIRINPYKIHKHKSQPMHHQDLLRERERERERATIVRLNLINHLVGFILCQICLYFSN